MSSHNKKSKTEIVVALARIESWTIIIEWAVVQQDVMVPPFDFINRILQENYWKSVFTCKNVYPRLGQEFYVNLKVDQISQMCPILKTIVRGQTIIASLTGTVANTHWLPLLNFHIQILWIPLH
jgi:hypothetical protein